MKRYGDWVRLAEHLKFVGPLDLLIELIPYRDFKMWVVRMDELWNTPDRHDYYIMQLAQTVHGLFSKQEPLDRFKLKFGIRGSVDPTNKTPAYVEYSKQMWMAYCSESGPRPGM